MHTRRGCESAARVLSRGNAAAEFARVFATPLPDRVGARLSDRLSTPRSCNLRALTLHLFLFAVCAERAPVRRGSGARAMRRAGGARAVEARGALASGHPRPEPVRAPASRRAACCVAVLLTLGRLEPLLTPPFPRSPRAWSQTAEAEARSSRTCSSSRTSSSSTQRHARRGAGGGFRSGERGAREAEADAESDRTGRAQRASSAVEAAPCRFGRVADAASLSAAGRRHRRHKRAH